MLSFSFDIEATNSKLYIPQMSLMLFPRSSLSTPLDRMLNHTLSAFSREFEDFDRDLVPYWHGKRNRLDFNRTNDKVISDASKFSVQLDVSSFDPSEMKVNIEDGFVVISGRHHEESEHHSSSSEFLRRYRIPDEVEIEKVKSSLDEEGHLTIEAPKKGADSQRSISIPIEFKQGKKQTEGKEHKEDKSPERKSLKHKKMNAA